MWCQGLLGCPPRHLGCPFCTCAYLFRSCSKADWHKYDREYKELQQDAEWYRGEEISEALEHFLTHKVVSFSVLRELKPPVGMQWSDSQELVGVKEFQQLLQLEAREEDLEKLPNPKLAQKWHALLHILYQQDGNRCTKEQCTHQKERGYAASRPYVPGKEQVEKLERDRAVKRAEAFKALCSQGLELPTLSTPQEQLCKSWGSATATPMMSGEFSRALTPGVLESPPPQTSPMGELQLGQPQPNTLPP